ncbi:MAG: hypothetical protein FJ102_01895 [Deltaproteobacteria bacterium]|nr:hypothetical protein [Deltaproteobacteria bacterium]
MSGCLLVAALALGDDGTGRCVLDRDPAIRRSGDDRALARELDKAGLPASAGLFYARAACEAPGDEDTLVHALARASTWGAREDLESFSRWLPIEKYPSRAPNLLAYVEGRRLRDEGNLDEAVKYLGLVSTKSDLYPRSQLMLGEVQARRGKLKTADADFASVTDDARDLDAQGRSSLARGWMRYGIRRDEEAAEFLRAAPAVLEREAALGWVWFMTSGKLAWDGSATPRGVHPEIDLLKVLDAFTHRLPEVESLTASFESTWGPLATALEKAVAETVAPSARGRLFQRYRQGVSAVPSVPVEFLDRWVRTRELDDLKRRHDQLLGERLQLGRPQGKRDEAVDDEIVPAMERVEERGGQLVARGVKRARDEVAAALEQSVLTRMESLADLGDPRALEAMREVQAKWPSGELAARIAITEGGDVIAGLRRACDAFPNSPEARYELALWLWQAGDREEAASHFREVGDGDRRRASQAHLGQYHFERGAFADARECFGAAKDSYMVAWCEWALGDKKAALVTMRGSNDKRAAADAAKMERAITGR